MCNNEIIKKEALYILENKATIRQAAKEFGYSKSAIHKHMTKKLQECYPQLYLEVRKVTEHNKEIRNIRGGEATKRKYSFLSGSSSK